MAWEQHQSVAVAECTALSMHGANIKNYDPAASQPASQKARESELHDAHTQVSQQADLELK